jgi:hypothetical protein
MKSVDTYGERVKVRKDLEENCRRLTVELTEKMPAEKKLKAGLNQRMMLEQLDRLLLRHANIEEIERTLCNTGLEKRDTGKLQRQYVNEAEGIAQHTYAVLAHYIKWIKSILPHPNRNSISNSVHELIDNCDKVEGLDIYWKSVLVSEYDFRTRFIDHPGTNTSYTWHTETNLDKRTYIHYYDPAGGTSFTPPHPDLVVNAVVGLISTGCQKYKNYTPGRL